MTFNLNNILILILAGLIGYLIVQNIQLTRDLKDFQAEQVQSIHDQIDQRFDIMELQYMSNTLKIDSILLQATQSRKIAERVEKKQYKLQKDNETLINSFNSILINRPDF